MDLNLFKKKNREENNEIKKNTTTLKRSYFSVTDEEVENYANGLNSDIRVMHFAHTDIGGKVCSLIAKKTFQNIDTVYYSNRDVNDAINTFVLIDKAYENYDLILVSDVTLNKGTFVTLDNLQKFTKGKVKVRYYNHQELNKEYPDKYSWVTVETSHNGIGQDSASILYRYMQEEYNLPSDSWLDEIVEKSRRYTKWEWIDLNDDMPNQLSMICHDTGHEFFVKKLIKKHIANSALIDDEDLDKLDYIAEKYKEYKETKINEVILTKVGTSKVGVVFAEQYINTLASDITKTYKNLDFVIIINSLVGINIRKSKSSQADGREIARIFGSNGEEAASGACIPVEIREYVLNYLIENLQEKINKIKK